MANVVILSVQLVAAQQLTNKKNQTQNQKRLFPPKVIEDGVAGQCSLLLLIFF